MPVYPDLGAIFVHIPKTAGGAIEEYLAPWALPRPSGPGARLLSHLPVAQTLGTVYLRGHDSAAWLRVKIGAAAFDAHFSFAIVRNPYDRLISSYEHVRQTPRHHKHAAAQAWGFERFLARRRRLDQVRYLGDRAGRLIVDHLIAFERLGHDLPPVFDRLGVPGMIGGERARNATVKRSPQTYLTPAALSLINRRAAADFALLGYRPITDAADYRPNDGPTRGPALRWAAS